MTRIFSLFVTLVLLASPLVAQQKRAGTTKRTAPATLAEPAPTFDTLLSADAYKIYGEVRAVGQLINSAGVNDLLDPVVKLAAPPKEFKTLFKWLNTHAEILSSSRMLFATWPTRTNVPQFLIAIEFPSAEEAERFTPQLRQFLPTLLLAPSPSPASSPAKESPKQQVAAKQTENDAETPPPYQTKRAGSLVLISATPFSFRALRPKDSKLLTEDQNFRQVRDRFASESVFLYVDIASIEKEEQERFQRIEEEQKKYESQIAAESSSQVTPDLSSAEAPSSTPEEPPPPPPPPVVVHSESPQATLGDSAEAAQTSGIVVVDETSPKSSVRAPDPISSTMFMFSNALFGGRMKWPEAIGAAVAFDPDSYVIRTLVVNTSENKANAIPFVPQFVSGPALAPEAPSIFPADAELFVTVSVDYAQIYDGMVKAMTGAGDSNRGLRRQTASQPESPYVAYEKKLGLKIKDDLLPLLGNEIAVSIPFKELGMGQSPPPTEPIAEHPDQTQPAVPSPVIAISVKDKEAVKRLIPKIIESLAFKGADVFARTEKRDDTEIVSYAKVFSYSFIGNFLVISTDPASTRHVVDSYLSNQTLSSDSHFRNFTRWQPRQVLGQAYISPALMESYNKFGKDINAPVSDKLRDFLSRLSPIAEPLTYALSNEGMGPLHELHIPKNFLLLMLAGMSSASTQSPLLTNEAVAKSALHALASAEATYKETKGDGRFGLLEELIAENFISKDMLQRYGYRIEVTVSGNGYEVTAVPVEYGKTGRMSYFLDQTGTLRGGDHGGGPATISDKPVQ